MINTAPRMAAMLLPLLIVTPVSCPDFDALETRQIEFGTPQSLPIPGPAFRGLSLSCNSQSYFAVLLQNGGEVETRLFGCPKGGADAGVAGISSYSCSQVAILPDIDTSLDCECFQDQTVVCAGVQVQGSTRNFAAYTIQASGAVKRSPDHPGQSIDCFGYPNGDVGCGAYLPPGLGQIEFFRYAGDDWHSEGIWMPAPGQGAVYDENFGASQFRITSSDNFLVLFWMQVFQGLGLYSFTTLDADTLQPGETLTPVRTPQPAPGNLGTSSVCVQGPDSAGVLPEPSLSPSSPRALTCIAYRPDNLVQMLRVKYDAAGLPLNCESEVVDSIKGRINERPSVSYYHPFGTDGNDVIIYRGENQQTFVRLEDVDGTSKTALRIPFGTPDSPHRPIAEAFAPAPFDMSIPGMSLLSQDPSSPQQTGGGMLEFVPFSVFNRISFPQFGDGDGFFSQITLSNPDVQNAAAAQMRIRNQAGEPLSFSLSEDRLTIPGSNASGLAEFEIPPGGRLTLQTDAQGTVMVGSVVVDSNRFLSGVVLFGGAFGLAGVPAVPTIRAGFTAPVEVITASIVNTGIAVSSLSNDPVRLTPTLITSDNIVLATATPIDLAAQGQQALFVTQFEWDANVDFSDFRGTLRIETDGPVAAAAIQTRPEQFATLPVTPLPGDPADVGAQLAGFHTPR